MEPVSQAPASAVLVCGIDVGSQFTHATDPPAFTCTVDGENTKFWMNTTDEPTGKGGTVQLPVTTVELLVVCSEKQAYTPSSEKEAMRARAAASRRVTGSALT